MPTINTPSNAQLTRKTHDYLDRKEDILAHEPRVLTGHYRPYT